MMTTLKNQTISNVKYIKQFHETNPLISLKLTDEMVTPVAPCPAPFPVHRQQFYCFYIYLSGQRCFYVVPHLCYSFYDVAKGKVDGI